MAHVMQDENERRQHSLSFHRSLRSIASRSLSGSHSSSALLEHMLEDTFYTHSSDNALLSEERILKEQNDDCGKSLADSLVGLLIPNASQVYEERIETNSGINHWRTAKASSKGAHRAESQTINVGTEYPSAPSDVDTTPRTLKPILRSISSYQSPISHISHSKSKAAHSSIGNHRSPQTNTPSTSIPEGSGHVCVVSTKDYDGERRGPSLNEEGRVSPIDFSRSHKQKEHKMAGVDRVVQDALQVNAYDEVIDMEWTETIPPSRKGSYSGMVDRKMRPHGKGRWVLYQDGSVMKELCGLWYKGSFIPNKYILQKFNDSRIPPLPFPKEESGEPKSHRDNRNRNEIKAGRFQMKQNYQLGEKLRSRNDIIDRRAPEGLQLITKLKTNDGAFVKRSSDGSFTYAILSRRYVDPKNNEDTLVFIVNSARSYKSIPQRMWNSCIRVENKQHDDDDSVARTSNQLETSPVCVTEKTIFTCYLPKKSGGSASSHTSDDDSGGIHWA